MIVECVSGEVEMLAYMNVAVVDYVGAMMIHTNI